MSYYVQISSMDRKLEAYITTFNSLNPLNATVAITAFFNVLFWYLLKTKVFKIITFCFRYLVCSCFIIKYAKFHQSNIEHLFYITYRVTGSLIQSKFWGIQWVKKKVDPYIYWTLVQESQTGRIFSQNEPFYV